MNKKNNYEEIDILVSTYQEGSHDAGQQLIERYQKYFDQYIALLKGKRFNIYNKTQRNFVKHFIRSKEVRSNYKSWRRSDYIRRVIYATVHDIVKRYECVEEDDLRSEMYYIFCHMITHHNFKAPFAIYVSIYFPLNFKKYIKEIGHHPREPVVEVPFDDDSIDIATYDTYELEDLRPRYYIQATDNSYFDENWINGITCNAPFDMLSIYERRIIKWYYEWKTLPNGLPKEVAKEQKELLRKTEDMIAERLGCSRKTINVKRNEIKKFLEIESSILHLLEG